MDVKIESFWNRILNPNAKIVSDENSSWTKEIEFLYKKGISMEEAVRYLHYEKPSLSVFNDWVNLNKNEIKKAEDIIDEVLTKEDLDFWDKNGYVVIKNAISRSDCEATQNAIWTFLRANSEDPTSWYQKHEEKRGLMLNFSNHPTLNKNRESVKIQKAYEQLYKTKKIYKTIDKVSFNPPISENYSFLGSDLHWDVSLKLPIPFKLQGLLYLSDCNDNDGAFHCVPGFHNNVSSWMSNLQANENPREIAPKLLLSKAVTGQAGDFIIWHQALPHCATPNKGKLPRMVQYLTYFPEEETITTEWI
ncbi:phytanoyl-CoA dioxygenase family protein [Flavobacterium sp.]|uniref:phytanoyl-CoA dioxygenase family protein n=1 Tax=Flavobacterium sp. TaxID=239 RepID=UPI0038FCC1F5